MLKPLLFAAACLLTLGAVGEARARSGPPDELLLKSGGVIRFVVNEPERMAKESEVPVLVALPPGRQSAEMASMAFDMYWKGLGAKGWVVVSPLARGDSPLLADADGALLELLDEVFRRYRPEGGRVHIAGVSNGGRAAFRFALGARAGRVASLTAMPGFAPAKEDMERLGELRGVAVRMFVGADDTVDWIEASRATLGVLRDGGVDATLTVRPGEGHVLKTTPEEITTILESLRPARAETVAPAAELDDFHAAAAAADGARYFAHFAREGVFLGTDAGERWSVAQFRAYAEPFFAQGKGWSYTPHDRNVTLGADGRTAWFDEKLDNEKYGECRGSGVLVLEEGRWKIAQYNLTVPVPNDLLADVARQIREFKGAAPK